MITRQKSSSSSQIKGGKGHMEQVFTLTRIFPLRLSGEGSFVESSLCTEDRSSLSPRISLRYWAIFFCCMMLQWFSIDRITGYLQRQATEQCHTDKPADKASSTKTASVISSYSFTVVIYCWFSRLRPRNNNAWLVEDKTCGTSTPVWSVPCKTTLKMDFSLQLMHF